MLSGSLPHAFLGLAFAHFLSLPRAFWYVQFPRHLFHVCAKFTQEGVVSCLDFSSPGDVCGIARALTLLKTEKKEG